jgi:tetratricopeptide (TPR) repeat protein
MKSHFTTREVAKILGLPQWRVRSCVRAGFLSPARGPQRHIAFSFQDLLLLKTTKGLLGARVPLQRIRRILHSLRRQLPKEQEIWNVKVFADGKRVVVWNGTARWQPDSGQFLFNFAAREVAQRVKLPLAKKSAPALNAEQWFDLAYELEKTSPEESRRAYREALALDFSLIEAHINLGRLYQEAAEFDKSERHYRAAIAQDPHPTLAYFNLGVLFEERGRIEEAVAAYEDALANDPSLADAHYSLGLIFEVQGRRSDAFKHFRAARKLYGPDDRK